MLILDTSGLLAALDRRDKHHERAAGLLGKHPCAERTRGLVLTFDVGDFTVVAQEGSIALG